jgi:hypothetical protein
MDSKEVASAEAAGSDFALESCGEPVSWKASLASEMSADGDLLKTL